MARFIKSSKGKDLIVDENNYTYRRERDNKNKTVTYYVCTEKCPVRIHAEYGTPTILKQVNEHCCIVTVFDVRKREFNNNLKEKAKSQLAAR